MYHRNLLRLWLAAVALFIVLVVMLVSCAPGAEVATTKPSPAEEPEPTTAPASPPPAPTDTAAPTETLTPTETPTPQATAPSNLPTLPPTSTLPPSDTPPLVGTFDVYLGAPLPSGEQLLRWVDVESGDKAAEILIHTADGYAVRAGQYVYYVDRPGVVRRANTAGGVETLSFAAPPGEFDYYDFEPGANGEWLAWVYGTRASGTYMVGFSYRDGSSLQLVASGEAVAGSTIDLVRVTNDGKAIFLDIRPPEIDAEDTLFGGAHDLYRIDVAAKSMTQIPLNPLCVDRGCPARISPDGAYLAVTLPPDVVTASVVVTNLVSGAVIARFVPLESPAGFAREVGYPFFTPGGELVYIAAYGAPGLESYQLIFANIVTGEQRIIADLGADRHSPLGWTGEGFVLLTTREPGLYDTWQFNIQNGASRQIAGMLFLGTVVQPEAVP